MLDLFTQKTLQHLWNKFEDSLTSEAAEEFLQILLTLMEIMFVIDQDYRKNIRKFNGRYQFRSADGRITVAAVFAGGRMRVLEEEIDDPHITVTFRDGRTLINFILAPRQDILGSMLRHDLKTRGNLNYLYKFGFMAKQLQLMMPQP